MDIYVSCEIDGWRKDYVWKSCTIREAKERAYEISKKYHPPYIIARKKDGSIIFYRQGFYKPRKPKSSSL